MRTYELENEGKRFVRCIKIMKRKDKIMAFICANADGSEKVELTVIDKAQGRRFFCNFRQHEKRFTQKNTWSDSALFEDGSMNPFLFMCR